VTSVTYPGGTDTFTYNALGQRLRATLNGATKRYVYTGERVLEETDDSGNMLVRYTLADSSYFSPMVQFKRADGTVRYPAHDAVGSVLRLLDGSHATTDTYDLDAFGRQLASTGTTPNPYRFGGEWGYITDPSGLLQLGARFYWPELGRFVQQDPIGDGMNWYAYVGNNPVSRVDPTGLHDTESIWHNMFSSCSWGAAKQGLAAWADGMIPFADPFAGSYNSSDPFLQASRTMGGVTRDAMISAGGAANFPAWLKNPVTYEVGQLTLPAGVYGRLASLAPAARGAELLSQYGALGTARLVAQGFRGLQFLNTVPQGLTPLGYIGSAGMLHGADRYFSGHW
jgi:RHS repeat-associated protein